MQLVFDGTFVREIESHGSWLAIGKRERESRYTIHTIYYVIKYNYYIIIIIVIHNQLYIQLHNIILLFWFDYTCIIILL